MADALVAFVATVGAMRADFYWSPERQGTDMDAFAGRGRQAGAENANAQGVMMERSRHALQGSGPPSTVAGDEGPR